MKLHMILIGVLTLAILAGCVAPGDNQYAAAQSITEDEAKSIAMAKYSGDYLGSKLTMAKAASSVGGSGFAELAWEVSLSMDAAYTATVVFVAADDGEILRVDTKKIDELQYALAGGITAGDAVKIATEKTVNAGEAYAVNDESVVDRGQIIPAWAVSFKKENDGATTMVYVSQSSGEVVRTSTLLNSQKIN